MTQSRSRVESDQQYLEAAYREEREKLAVVLQAIRDQTARLGSQMPAPGIRLANRQCDPGSSRRK